MRFSCLYTDVGLSKYCKLEKIVLKSILLRFLRGTWHYGESKFQTTLFSGARALHAKTRFNLWMLHFKMIPFSGHRSGPRPYRDHQTSFSNVLDRNVCHRLNCDHNQGGVMGSVLMCIFSVD